MSQQVPNVRVYTLRKAFLDDFWHTPGSNSRRARCDPHKLLHYGTTVMVTETLDFEAMCPLCHSMAFLDTSA